jgi:predicted nuclease with TOPRIM domain
MEKKMKFVIVGLVAILMISLFINLQLSSSRQNAIRERDELKRESAALVQKVESSIQEGQRLQEKINSLNADLERVTSEKGDLEKRLELISKERQDLADKLKEQKRIPALAQAPAGPVTEDAYWAGILKAKTDLEIQLESIRSELKTAQANNEQLQRDKAGLELEVTSLTRDKQDLKRQLDYNQKLMDSIAQDLVREKNDKFQIGEVKKSIKSDNDLLRRQLRALDIRRANVEKRLSDLQDENTKLNNQLKELEANLEDKGSLIDSLNKELSAIKSGKPLPAEKGKESVELPPIVVRPAVSSVPATSAGVGVGSALVGKILAINRDNNFVVIDLGTSVGIKPGDKFQVYRDDSVIANLEVIQTREKISACDIKRETSPIKVGDGIK